MDYILYHKDKALLNFQADEYGVELQEINQNNFEFLPHQLKRSQGRGLHSWLTDRAVDTDRSNIRRMLKEFKLTRDKLQIVLFNNAMCMTDWYWVKRTGQSLTLADHIRYKASDKNIAALSIYGSEVQISATYNPELTTIGSFDKCWINNKLIKKGSQMNTMAELASYEILSAMALPHATYFLEQDGVVATPNFTDEDVFLEHYASFRFQNLNENPMDISEANVYNHFKQINGDLAEQYLAIITMDSILCNADRHEHNFGVLRSCETGEVVSLAPNFDNNLALGAAQPLTLAMLKHYWDILNHDILQLFSELDLSLISFVEHEMLTYLIEVQRYIKKNNKNYI
jgi:hypothetical protein